MNVEDCFKLGYISRAHGVKGELRVVLDSEDLIDLEELESVYVYKDTRLTQFFFESVRMVGPGEALVRLKEVPTRTEAEQLARCLLYLPKTMLPPLDEGDFYYHEITGFAVEDVNLGKLGRIVGVEQMPAQDLIRMFYKGREVLIPIAPGIVNKVDRETKVVHTALPEGLLEVYLGGGEEEE